MADTEILGVVTRDADGRARVAYLNGRVPASPDILALTGAVAPTEVMRLSARCEQSACTHFRAERCSLVDRIVAMMDEVTDTLPPCAIRPSCRWHRQAGAAACRRCPQIVTTTTGEDDRLARVAQPALEGSAPPA